MEQFVLGVDWWALVAAPAPFLQYAQRGKDAEILRGSPYVILYIEGTQYLLVDI